MVIRLTPHIGGKKILLKQSGKDATKKFENFHNASVLQTVASQFLIGEIGTGVEEEASQEEEEEEGNEKSPLTVGETFGDMVPFGDPMW